MKRIALLTAAAVLALGIGAPMQAKAQTGRQLNCIAVNLFPNGSSRIVLKNLNRATRKAEVIVYTSGGSNGVYQWDFDGQSIKGPGPTGSYWLAVGANALVGNFASGESADKNRSGATWGCDGATSSVIS